MPKLFAYSSVSEVFKLWYSSDYGGPRRMRKQTVATILLAAFLQVSSASAQAPKDPFAPNPSGAKATTISPTKSISPNDGGVIANVQFVDTPITSIFQMISDLTGSTIIMSPAVTEKPPKINIWVKNQSPDQVLEQVALLGGLVLQRKANLIQVTTFEEYARLTGVEKRVIPIKHGQAADLAKTLLPLIDKDKDSARILADESSNRLILLLPEKTLDSFERLIAQLDVIPENERVVVIQLRQLEAPQIASALEEFIGSGSGRGGKRSSIFSGKQGDSPTESNRPGGTWNVQFLVETKLNVVVLRGLPSDVDKTIDLIKKLDVPNDVKVVSYQLKYNNAKDVTDVLDKLIKDETEKRQSSTNTSGANGAVRLRVASSPSNNQIIVEGSPQDHVRLSLIISAIDQPLPPGTGGIRIYRLENAASGEVSKVLQDLIAQRYGKQNGYARNAVNTPNTGGDSITPVQAQVPIPGTPVGPSQPSGAPVTTGANQAGQNGQTSAGDVLPPSITEAPEINAIIVRASATEQEEFGLVVREMDQPRQQVMLEVTIVSVVATNDFTFGLEIGGGKIGSNGLGAIGFSTFGIGAVNPATGGIRIANPAPPGGNVGVFAADDFSLIMNALRTKGNTRVMSSPKVLVQDNGKAEITQKAQEPYQQASQGTSTTITGFGGFVDAGTTLRVQPHIAKDNWLRLEYDIQLSSFGTRSVAQALANLPPPRRENTSLGTVRVPNDHMVVLGGLVGSKEQRTEDKVFILGDIPLLGALFTKTTNVTTHETVFIFIRPLVLKSPDYRDLIYLSQSDIQKAKVQNDFYPKNPLRMIPDPTIDMIGLEE